MATVNTTRLSCALKGQVVRGHVLKESHTWYDMQWECHLSAFTWLKLVPTRHSDWPTNVSQHGTIYYNLIHVFESAETSSNFTTPACTYNRDTKCLIILQVFWFKIHCAWILEPLLRSKYLNLFDTLIKISRSNRNWIILKTWLNTQIINKKFQF